ncbi:hypothetical protein EDC04DRAFT_2874740 [Pisolithus marmoratus]|nr:hypothetical protein EDC04DRAFT_2874740 [Pisolithus marmoratus]
MKAIGLCPVYPPFWVNLLHSDIFQAFTPNLLHQLHKAVFKEHPVKWCVAIIDNEEIDAHFKCMMMHHGLQHFKNWISSVTQWTGKEHKEMEKIFLGLVAGAMHFNIPKVHSMQHYVELISHFGSADSFNTEIPECLHIDYAKEAYCASNKKDFITQMTVWLHRQESIDQFDAYLDWKHGWERARGEMRKDSERSVSCVL